MGIMRVIRAKRLIVLTLAIAPLFLSGCVLEEILDGIVNEPPAAVIEASPREGSAPLDVDFNAQFSRDDGMIVEYRWNFGDPVNTKSALESATTHTFSRPGTYLVKLTVIDDEGKVNSQQVAIVVTDAPPIAKASVDNDSPLPGEDVVFSATESYDLQGEIVSYHWEFGDGRTGTGETSEHTYAEGGEYTATLTVTNESGEMAQVHLDMTVQLGQSSCGDDVSSCGSARQPIAAITSEYFATCNVSGTVGEPITLDGSASYPAVGSMVSYHWDFGDGSTGTGATVSHVYSKAWTYAITLTVVDEGGGIGTARGSVSVSVVPAASCP